MKASDIKPGTRVRIKAGTRSPDFPEHLLGNMVATVLTKTYGGLVYLRLYAPEVMGKTYRAKCLAHHLDVGETLLLCRYLEPLDTEG
jgi:hypothetical protein